MNKNLKILIAIFIVLLSVSIPTIVYAREDISKRIPATKDIIPNSAPETIPSAQLAYTDIWTTDATDIQTNYDTRQTILTKTIYLRYPSELIVTISTESKAPSNGITSILDVTIDENYISPGAVYLDTDPTWKARSFTFVKTYLPAGKHIVKANWSPGGTDAVAWYRSMSIIANGYGH